MVKDLTEVIPVHTEPSFQSELEWWNMELQKVQNQKTLLEVQDV